MKSRAWFLLAVFLALPSCEKVKTLTEIVVKKSEVKAAGKLNSDQISVVNAANYSSFTAQKDRLVIVDFYADWCPPCRMLSPVLKKAAAAHPGVVVIGKVDVDQSKNLAISQQVSSIPDVRIFKNGVQVERIIGFLGEAEILRKIDSLSAGITPVADGTSSEKSANLIQPRDKDWLPPGMQKR